MTKQTVTNMQAARYPKRLFSFLMNSGLASKSYYLKSSGWLRKKSPYDSEIQDPKVLKGLSLQSLLPRVQVTRKVIEIAHSRTWFIQGVRTISDTTSSFLVQNTFHTFLPYLNWQ